MSQTSHPGYIQHVKASLDHQRSEKKNILGQLAGFWFCHCLIWEKWRSSTHSFRSWTLL